MRLPINIIQEEIIKQYNLQDIVHEGNVYIEIQKVMPGLKLASRIANDRLVKHLAPHKYATVSRTISLWSHKTNSITFALFSTTLV